MVSVHFDGLHNVQYFGQTTLHSEEQLYPIENGGTFWFTVLNSSVTLLFNSQSYCASCLTDHVLSFINFKIVDCTVAVKVIS